MRVWNRTRQKAEVPDDSGVYVASSSAADTEFLITMPTDGAAETVGLTWGAGPK